MLIIPSLINYMETTHNYYCIDNTESIITGITNIPISSLDDYNSFCRKLKVGVKNTTESNVFLIHINCFFKADDNHEYKYFQSQAGIAVFEYLLDLHAENTTNCYY
jgi:hypothetical protein